MTPSPWKPIGSAPIGVPIWIGRLDTDNQIRVSFEMLDTTDGRNRVKDHGWTHWMEPIPLPVEDGFEEWLTEYWPTGCLNHCTKLMRDAWDAGRYQGQKDL